MKGMLAASIVALCAAAPALAQTGNGYMVMCKVDSFPYMDAETESTLQWQQLVACADAYRAQKMSMETAARQQSGASGADNSAASRIGTGFMLRVRQAQPGDASYACPASAMDEAGGQGHVGDCIPGGRN
jgi:hypothetical protein